MSTRDVALGFGANVGDGARNVAEALLAVRRRGFDIERESSLYLTEPVGGPPQNWYFNAVAIGSTALSSDQLLDVCLAVEAEFGRVRTTPNEPRPLDIDLLLFGREARRDARLSLPHPRMHQRRFVLQPLAEIAPDWVHPTLGETIATLLSRCTDPSTVIVHEPVATRE